MLNKARRCPDIIPITSADPKTTYKFLLFHGVYNSSFLDVETILNMKKK